MKYEYPIFEIGRGEYAGKIKLRAVMYFHAKETITVQSYIDDRIEIGKALEILEQQLSRAVGDVLVMPKKHEPV